MNVHAAVALLAGPPEVDLVFVDRRPAFADLLDQRQRAASRTAAADRATGR